MAKKAPAAAPISAALDGKKTKTAAVAMAAAVVAQQMGYLTPDQVQAAVTLAGALGLFGLRDAVAKK